MPVQDYQHGCRHLTDKFGPGTQLQSIIKQADHHNDGRSPKQGKEAFRHPGHETVEAEEYGQPERPVDGNTAADRHWFEMNAPLVGTLNKPDY